MAAIDVVLDEGLPERALRLGAQLRDRLASIKTPPQVNHKVTGQGLLMALHLDESHPSGRVTATRLCKLALKKGLIAIPTQNRIRIAPPLAISEEDLWKGVDILEEALNELVVLEKI
jgi:ornithine--oxo-acid transaminase